MGASACSRCPSGFGRGLRRPKMHLPHSSHAGLRESGETAWPCHWDWLRQGEWWGGPYGDVCMFFGRAEWCFGREWPEEVLVLAMRAGLRVSPDSTP